MEIITIHHPLTFEFLPGISYTRFRDASLLMLTFGTWSVEIIFKKETINNNDNNNNTEDNGNSSSCSSASA